jgi:hypothetical protein
MPDMTVDNEGLTARQRFIFNDLKSSILVEGSDEDLLLEMVKQGLVILHYGFGNLTPILHTMIVENRVFTQRLEKKKSSSIIRWSTFGDKQTLRVTKELIKHDVFVQFLNWLAIVFPFGNITKSFFTVYKN